MVIPTMLAILILNIKPNVIFTTLKSSTIGDSSPNCCPNDIQFNQSMLEASCPNKPPITNPDNINIINIHIFLSLVAIFWSPY